MPPASPRAPAPPPERLSWLLLAAAFSPVLIDLVAHLGERPWAAYCLVFVPLFADLLRRAPRRTPRPREGWGVLVLALALELLLVAGDWTRAARPALVLGALGIALLQGRPGARAVALLLGFVPVPHALVSWASPALELRLGLWAAEALRLAGLPALAEADRYQARFRAGGASFPLSEVDGGVAVACLIAGLAWYAGCQRGWSLPATLARAALLVWLAIPVQVLALVGAGVLTASGAAPAVRGALDVAPWAAVAAFALLGPCRPGRAAPPAASERLPSGAP
jgi:hypothetical protein